MAIFQIKNSDIFHMSPQNIDCGYSLKPPPRGGSNEYTQSMFLSRNNKNNVYPCKPQFYYIKAGFKGSKLYRYVFVMSNRNSQVFYCVKTAESLPSGSSVLKERRLYEARKSDYLYQSNGPLLP